jgi:hypothetical protein
MIVNVAKARPSEDFVSYSILKHLTALGWTILQYHPPGGGAAFPVRFGDGRIIYPDITAAKAARLLVVENKSRFDPNDVEKLRQVAADKCACACIRSFAVAKAAQKRIKVVNYVDIRFAHGYAGKANEPLVDIELFCVSDNGVVQHIPSAMNRQ